MNDITTIQNLSLIVTPSIDYQYAIPVNVNTDYNSLIKSETFGAITSKKCLTCAQYNDKCYGHWGRIVLSTPIVKPAFIRYLNTILPKLCLHCGIKIPIKPKDEEILSQHHFLDNNSSKNYKSLIRSLKSYNDNTSTCKRCNTPPHKYKLTTVFSNQTTTVDHIIIYNLLKSIPYHYYPIISDIKTSFENLFFVNNYPIIPLYLRRSHDMYQKDIIIESSITKRYIELISIVSSNDVGKIQNAINELERNNEEVPNSYLSQVYLGKKSIFRNLINAYTGDHTVRVILNVNRQSDPDVGLMCRDFYNMISSIIYYNQFTHTLIMHLISLQKVVMIFSNGKYYNIKRNLKTPIKLNFGDYIECFLIDLLEVNYKANVISYRQPALHKGSIVGQVIGKNKTTAFNGHSNTLCTLVLAGLNGDQDGDEFGSRLITNPMSLYEHKYIIRPRNNIIYEGDGMMAYGMIQLELLTFLRLSFRGKFYKSMMPLKLKDAEFKNISIDDVGFGKNTNTLFKNIIDHVSPAESFKLFTKIVKYIKLNIGLEQMSFSGDEIYNSREFHLKAKRDIIDDLTNVQIKFKNNPSLELLTTEMAKIVKKYTEHYAEWLNKQDLQSHNYALISYSGLKMNPKFFMESILLQPSSKLSLSYEGYLNRSFPFYPSGTLDIGASGVIKNGYYFGLTMRDMTNVFAPAINKIVITSLLTALPGKISRDLVKTMEDLYIDELGFVISYGVIIDTCVNIYKMLNNQLYMIPLPKIVVDYITNNANNNNSYKVNNKILEKYLDNYSHLFVRGITVMKDISFPIDLDFVMKNMHTLLAPCTEKFITDKILTDRISEFSKYIKYNYFYSLGHIDIQYNIILISYFLDKEITLSQLNYILNIIEKKHKLSPPVGYPIGMLTALVIGEHMTQATISNFHDVKKDGGDINLDSIDNNINYINLNLNKDDNIIIIKALTDRSLKDLYLIKQRYEYCNLKLLDYRLINITSNNGMYQLIIELNKNKVIQYNLTLGLLESIIAYNLEEIIYIDQCSIECSITSTMNNSNVIEVIIQVNLNQRFLPIFLISLPYFSKGIYAENRFSISDKQLIMIGDVELLSDYDTSEMSIKLTTEYSYKYGTLQVFNMLMNNYAESKLKQNNFRLLSAFQCRFSKPVKVKKYNNNLQPLTSAITHTNNYYDMQNAALINQEQFNSINTSILFKRPIKMGTGFYETYIDLTPYLRSKVMDSNNVKGPEAIVLD